MHYCTPLSLYQYQSVHVQVHILLPLLHSLHDSSRSHCPLRSLPDGSAWVLDSYPVTVEQAKVATVFGADLHVQRAVNVASIRTQFAVQNRVMVVLSTHM